MSEKVNEKNLTFKNRIRKLFGMKYDGDTVYVRRLLAMLPVMDKYSIGENNPDPFLHHITDVKVSYQGQLMMVDINTHRPGLMIGKKGWNFNAIQKFLQEDSDIQSSSLVVKLNLEECKLWHDLG